MIEKVFHKLFPDKEVGNDNVQNREHWLESTLRLIPAGSSILDAGAGECQYKKFCHHLKYTSQDFAQYTGEGDQKGLQMGTFNVNNLDIVSDITSIPLPDSSFDSVMCIEVLEHLPEPIKAVEELKRILKTRGYLIITAPFCSLTHYSPYHFASGFNKYFYEYILKSNFEIIEIVPNGDYFSYLAQETRRLSSVAEKYSGFKSNLLFRINSNLFLYFLSKFKKADSSSHELLCFGYNVFARKR